MFLLYMLVILLMFPAAGLVLFLFVHEGLYLLNSAHRESLSRRSVVDSIKRATQEVTAILGLGDD